MHGPRQVTSMMRCKLLLLKLQIRFLPSTFSMTPLMKVTYANKKFKFFLKWNYRVNAFMTYLPLLMNIPQSFHTFFLLFCIPFFHTLFHFLLSLFILPATRARAFFLLLHSLIYEKTLLLMAKVPCDINFCFMLFFINIAV